MIRRRFLRTTALAIASLPSGVRSQTGGGSDGRGPTLLTVTGAISRPNRGPFDSALDQMMGKQKVSFVKAHAFDFAALARLPAVAIRPTLEYDARVHALSGPLLADVVGAAGGPTADSVRLVLRAVDGYAVNLSMADARKYRYLVATRLDGQPMPLGGLGPLWAVYEADRYADMAARPLNQRFVSCPWALYHIEASPA